MIDLELTSAVGSPPDIVYNYTSNLWACCGNNTAGQVTCNDPLNEYYEAPAPGDLAIISSGAAVASSATLTPYTQRTSTATTTSNSSVTSAQVSEVSSKSATPLPSTESKNLSTGPKVGIAIAVALGVIAVVAAALLWLRKSKSRRRSNETLHSKFHGSELEEKCHRAVEMPVHGDSRQELDTNDSGTIVELGGEATLYHKKHDVQVPRLELPTLS